jgi:hypothetical protein
MTDLEKRARLEAYRTGLDSLLKIEPEADEASEAASSEKKKGGKGRFGSGGTSSVSLGSLISDILTRRRGPQSPSILGLSEPSDGHPQEELTPDFCWFRPLAQNNQTWVLYWPELTV